MKSEKWVTTPIQINLSGLQQIAMLMHLSFIENQSIVNQNKPPA